MVDVHTGITDRPLDVAAALDAATRTDCGGVAAFVGRVRATPATTEAPDARVERLEYEAHPTLAAERLAAIADEAAARWDVRTVVAIHRTGVCALGEPTVVVVCAAPHRSDALDACKWVIDTIKSTVPIWKREMFADGAAWVGPPA